ncbi:MAG: hypothetical protein P9L99_15540 [Candidatus Lernaella stagnicola]|nr:hypothetical protein [Candidatus Lernaella stagnicola]
MKRSATILAIALLLTGFLLGGCIILEEDEEVDELPARGYGTLKLSIDDVGPFDEFDEAGQPTGRRGFMFDLDHDGDFDYFYQIRRPSAGIVGLSFGADGFADGAFPQAMVMMTPGQTDYEVPLDSLTTWINQDRIVGYRPAKYIDRPDVLVYRNRLYDREEEAPLTGTRQSMRFRFLNVGVINVGGGANAPIDDEDPISNDDVDEPDLLPAAFGEPDARCDDWFRHCEKLETCDRMDWSVQQCADHLYPYTNTAPGQRYIRCLGDCKTGQNCDKYLPCVDACWADNFSDAYGCESTYGPDAVDILLFVERDGALFQVEQGYTVQQGEKLAVYIWYRDVEGDFGNGQINVQGIRPKLSVPIDVRSGTLADRTLVGFTVANPLPAGEYKLSVRLRDNVDECGREGVPFPVSFNSAGVTGVDNAPVEPGVRSLNLYETYARKIDKYNAGKGFIDESVVLQKGDEEGYRFLYEITDFDVAIIQAYFWSFSGLDDFDVLDIDELNQSIVTTTQDDRGTKFDPSDDIQSSAFYIDQPMGSGLFTFYGDRGWNIYPKAPYGAANDNQPFIRGDLETTRVHIPFTPFYTVDPKYTGCGNLCSHWLSVLYDEGGALGGFDSLEEAVANCQANSGTQYWVAALQCVKQSDDGDNACQTINDCLSVLGAPPTGGNRGLCQTHENLTLPVRVVVPPEYLANDEYRQLLLNDQNDPNWRPLKLALFAQTGGDTGLLVPGGEELGFPQENYDFTLPYGPHVPNSVFQISTPEAGKQAQLSMGLLNEETGQIYGGAYNEPNAIYEDDDWYWLFMYSYNWVGIEQEGWGVGVVSGNTIYDFVNPANAAITVVFGDLRFISSGFLNP